MTYEGKRAAVAAGHQKRQRKRSLLSRIIRLVLAPFFFVFRTVFTLVLLSVISFLAFYFHMQGTPEKQQQYDKIMEAAEQVPAVLGGLAQQAGLTEIAQTLGYDPKPEDAEKSQQVMKNLCAQLEAVDNAEPLPWKQGDASKVEPEIMPEAIPEDGTVESTPDATPEAEPEAVAPPVAATPAVAEAVPAIAPDEVPPQLQPILDALKKAKNLDTIRERLSAKHVGQRGEGAVLFLDKLLEKDQGALRLAALESLRNINTKDSLEIMHKYTRTLVPPTPVQPTVPTTPAAPEDAKEVAW